jgi:hypothetical protein
MGRLGAIERGDVLVVAVSPQPDSALDVQPVFLRLRLRVNVFLPQRAALPLDLEEYKGYHDYFLSRRRWFFGFAALTEALDVIDTWIKGDAHLQSFGPEYLVSVGVFILLCGIASITRNVKFHMAFVLGAFAYEMSFFTRYFHTLN